MTNVDISFVPNSHSFPKVEKAIPQPEEINLNSLAAASPEDFLPHPDYGSLQGTVSSISPDAIEPQSNFNSSNSSLGMGQISQTGSYKVNIKPENYVLKIAEKECAIQLGMEGSADIISKEETVLQFILRKARLIANV